jgi:hypothetical protein
MISLKSKSSARVNTDRHSIPAVVLAPWGTVEQVGGTALVGQGSNTPYPIDEFQPLNIIVTELLAQQSSRCDIDEERSKLSRLTGKGQATSSAR